MNFFKKIKNKVTTYFADQDHQQRISIAASFIGDGFRVVMASILCVFVPQGCIETNSNNSLFNSLFGNTYPSIDNQLNGTTNTLQICTMTENFTDLIDFNVGVLALNFFTLGCFIYLYIIELKRENWMIDTLQYDESKSEHNITVLKEEYPEVITQLQIHNKKYKRAYGLLQYIYVGNFIASAVLVLYYYYFDYRTITVLLTNVALCWTKISNGKEVAIKSYKNEYAYSYFNIKHLGFNAIDPKYQKPDSITMETDVDDVRKNIQIIKKYIQTF